MNESVSKTANSRSNAENGYHWRGFVRFDNAGHGLFCAVLVGGGKNVPDRMSKAVYTKEELPDVYSRFIRNGYSFSHCSIKDSYLVRNWRTGEVLCTTTSFLESILIANSYSICYELMQTAPLDINIEFENYQSAQQE